MKVIPAMKLLLNKKYNSEKGITLIELMMTIVFVSLIVGLVSTIFLSANKTSSEVIDITRSGIDSRLAIYRMSKDIREANGIILAKDDQIKFLSNVDSDSNYEEISYFLENENGYFNLIRNVDSGKDRTIITHIINNDLFKYFSEIQTPENGMSTPVTSLDLENIKLVGLNLNVDQNSSQSLRTMDLDTIVLLRNKI